MATNNAQVGRPVLTTALLQIGVLGQMLGEADRVIGYTDGLDPVSFLPEAFSGQAFLMMSLMLQVLALVNFILLMIWLFKATRFISSKAAPPLTISPGWAIGWWFIPIANLIMPWLVMSELYKASRSPENWNFRGLPVLPFLWWGATLSGVAVGIAARFGKSFYLDLPPADILYAGVYSCGSVRLLLLLIVVTVIAHFQKKVPAAIAHTIEAIF